MLDMTIETVLGEIHRRLQYRNWYVRTTIKEGKLIIVVCQLEFFEPKVLEHIMKQYDYEYETKIMKRCESKR